VSESIDFEALLARDDDSLLELLAEQTVLAANRLDQETKRKLGQAWLDAQLARLRELVCGDPVVERDRGADDLVDTLAAVTDLVASVAGRLPAATVAVLLTRSGLDRLCA